MCCVDRLNAQPKAGIDLMPILSPAMASISSGHGQWHGRSSFQGTSSGMENMNLPFLSLTLWLTTSTVLAQARTPVQEITTATLEQYRGEYRPSPLCSKDEITLWSCKANKRVFSLCSSKVATRTTGYFQYRASNAGKLTFAHPATKKPPLGTFKYDTSANGDASVEFTNGGYHYNLIDLIRGNSSIRVSAPGSSSKETEIACGGNQTLQVNYTMRLMYDSGVWTGE